MSDATPNPTDTRPALVVGATGKQGGATARALINLGIPVRALVRDPESVPARALRDLGADLVAGDLYESDSLVGPCTDVRAVFSVLRPDMSDPAADAERVHARNLISAAVSARVPHFVQTSVSGVGHHVEAPGWSDGYWHRSYHEAVPPISDYWMSKHDVNEMVRAAGFHAWTILLPSTFMEMFRRPSVYFEDWTSNRLVAPVNPDTTYSLIAVEDIGRAAAAAIADPERFNGVELELAGDVLTLPQIANVLSKAWEEDIVAPPLPMSAEQALARGQVAPIVQSLEWIRDAGQRAKPEHLRAYGVEPSTFDAWARTHRK